MPAMTLVDIINVLYPNQLLVTIGLGQSESNGTIRITSWQVPDVPQPTEEYLLSLIPQYQHQWEYDNFVRDTGTSLSAFIDSVAQLKQYDSAIACISYLNSTVDQWRTEASVFIAWRDSVLEYTYAQLNLMNSNGRTIPTFADFINELPVITW